MAGGEHGAIELTPVASRTARANAHAVAEHRFVGLGPQWTEQSIVSDALEILTQCQTLNRPTATVQKAAPGQLHP
jgi:hypothetical protein